MSYVIYSSWASRTVTLHDAGCAVVIRDSARYVKGGRQQYNTVDDVRSAVALATAKVAAVGGRKWSECDVCIPFIPADIT